VGSIEGATLRLGAIVLAVVGAMGVIGATGAIGAMAPHHSVLPFDGASATTIEGTVARVLWQNPHTLITVDVESVRWTIESEAAGVLQRLGWTETTIKSGDRVTVTGARAKDGRRLMRCKTITMTNGNQLLCFGGQTPVHGDSRP
jgi:hypothetical protein